MEGEKLFGILFNSIPLQDENHLDVLLETMDDNNSKIILIEAVKYAHSKGIFTLGESEVLSKSIRVITKKTENNS